MRLPVESPQFFFCFWGRIQVFPEIYAGIYPEAVPDMEKGLTEVQPFYQCDGRESGTAAVKRKKQNRERRV